MHLLIIGGSDAGISAALRARELDDAVEVTVVLADAYPNFSICGIPYYVSGDVGDWHDLAHRTRADIENLGIAIVTDTTARHIDVDRHEVSAIAPGGAEVRLGYDRLVVATGAVPRRPPIDGLEQLGPAHGVHLLHTIGDTHSVMDTLVRRDVSSAVIVGAGYVGLEMSEALSARGITVTQIEALAQVLPTLDPELAQLVADRLAARGVEVRTSTTATGIAVDGRRLTVRGRSAASGTPFHQVTDLVLVVAGVTPDTALAAASGLGLARNTAIAVDRRMATDAPDVYAAGDCAVTHHALLGETYLPLGTTAHKQGRIAGENAIGGDRSFAGSLGTQVVKVFDLVAARTGLRDQEASAAGFHPRTEASTADDHKAYYPGAQRVHVRVTGDVADGRLLGVQMVGPIASAVHKRIDTAATAIFCGLGVEQLCELDLSYAPPLGSPWDVLQEAGQHWAASGDRGDGPSSGGRAANRPAAANGA